MKKSKFTDSQIISILKANEVGAKVSDLYCQHSISQAAFYKWRSKFGGMDMSMVKCLKELETENARLNKVYVEEHLKAEFAGEKIKKSCNSWRKCFDSHWFESISEAETIVIEWM